MLYDNDGDPLGGEAQEESWFYTPVDREGDRTFPSGVLGGDL